MAGERSYVRVPPDSTGKKVRHEPHHRVGFSKVVGQEDHIWQLGLEYVITDGLDTYNVIVFRGPVASVQSGQLGLLLSSDDEFNNEDISASATIAFEGTTIANLTSDEIIHVPYVHLSGGNAPQNTVDVDRTGSMNIRFDEGRPQLDGFGRLRTSQGTTLGDYVFAYDTLQTSFSTTLVGRGAVEHDTDLRCLKLTCPGGAPGATYEINTSRDQVSHTTNTYHHYFPGFSHEAIMTVALVNLNTSGLVRNWGYFDSDNGYMFRYDQTDGEFKCVIRSSASGNLVETRISRTGTQVYNVTTDTEILSNTNGWDGDPVDGTGESQMDLRLTDDNIYWLDIQWLGAGRVRFGTYHRGQRVVIHEYYHEGDTFNNGKPSSQSGSLPICFSMVNDGAGYTGDANILAWCAAAHTEHSVDLNTIGSNRLETITKTAINPTALENGQDYELIGVLMPADELVVAGIDNRTLYLPNYMEVMAYHADGSQAMVEFEIYLDPVMGGGDFAFPINSDDFVTAPGTTPYAVPVDSRLQNAVEVYKPEDYTPASDRAKFWGGGLHILSAYTRGETRIDLGSFYNNFQDGAFKNYAENGGTQDHAVGAWTLSPDGVTATKYTATGDQLNHREGYAMRFYGVTGTASTVLNYDENGGQEFYIRVTAKNEAELYEDLEFQTPVITNGLTVTANGRMRADYGQQMYFVAVMKPLAPAIAKYNTDNTQTITAHFNLGWSEIIQ